MGLVIFQFPNVSDIYTTNYKLEDGTC